MFKYDICTVGGCGRVGLPLSIAFADRGKKVVIYDIDDKKMEMVRSGKMPFMEHGCDQKLKDNIGKNLVVVDDANYISESKFIIVTIGTPVEEHLNPQYDAMKKFFLWLSSYLRSGQIVILRSTVFPGVSEKINRLLIENKKNVGLMFCPERIAEGKALEEIENLPQIISGFDKGSVEEVKKLFSALSQDIIVLSPFEAELAKLFTNVWRYIHFSISNQFYMIANSFGQDFYRIYEAITYKYPRTKSMPTPGFTAGPCLLKDTMQLAALSNNSFFLGHVAMLINEGLPNYIVSVLRERTDLQNKKVGILGMTFKADLDDKRDSLSFKLKKMLEIEAREVYCSDVYLKEENYVNSDKLIDECDIIIIGVPHKQYKNLKIKEDKLLVDVWNSLGKGGKF